MLRRIKKRLQAEWAEYSDPEIKLGKLFRGRRQDGGKQVFRSLVQVNLYAKPRRD